MGTYKVPGQNLTFPIPDEGEVFLWGDNIGVMKGGTINWLQGGIYGEQAKQLDPNTLNKAHNYTEGGLHAITNQGAVGGGIIPTQVSNDANLFKPGQTTPGPSFTHTPAPGNPHGLQVTRDDTGQVMTQSKPLTPEQQATAYSGPITGMVDPKTGVKQDISSNLGNTGVMAPGGSAPLNPDGTPKPNPLASNPAFKPSGVIGPETKAELASLGTPVKTSTDIANPQIGGAPTPNPIGNPAPIQPGQINNSNFQGNPNASFNYGGAQPGTGFSPTAVNPSAGGALTPEQQTQYNQLIAAGADPNTARNAAMQVPGQPQGGQQGQQQTGQPGYVPNFPTTNLQPGMRGEGVQQLQQFLIDQGYAIPDGATGFYGPQTKAAVTKWQQDHGVQAGQNFGFWGPKSISAAQSAYPVGAGDTGNSSAGGLTGTDQAPGQEEDEFSMLARIAKEKFGLDLPDPNKSPISRFSEMYSQLYKDMGLDSVKTQMESINKEYADVQNELNDKIQDIRDNPWFSEGIRIKREESMNERYEGRLNNLTNKLKLYQSVYESGREDARFAAQQGLALYQDQQALAQDMFFKAIDIAESRAKAAGDGLKPTSEMQEYLFALEQGYGGSFLDYKKVLANFKDKEASGAGGGGSGLYGLSNQQIDNAGRISSSFEGSPIVKNFIEVQNRYLSAKQFTGRGDGASDIAVIYELMKSLDPTSVVRTEEYETGAKKSGNIFAGGLAYLNGLIKPQGGFISPQAKQNIFNVVEAKYNVQKKQYDSFRSEKLNQADTVTGGMGSKFITDYAGNVVNSEPTDEDRFNEEFNNLPENVAQSDAPKNESVIGKVINWFTGK